MSRGVARQTDRTFGTCFAHDPPISVGGSIVSSSPLASVTGLPSARQCDMVVADCGHVSSIVTASSVTSTAGMGNARQSDSVGSGPYRATIVTSSATVTTP